MSQAVVAIQPVAFRLVIGTSGKARPAVGATRH